MFSRKKKKNNEEKTISTIAPSSTVTMPSIYSTSFQSSTSGFTRTTTEVQRSRSVSISHSYISGTNTPPNSLDSNAGSGKVSYLRSQLEPKASNHVALDAIPFTANVPKVTNMNYQSPYRNSTTYNNLRPSSIATVANNSFQRSTPIYSSLRQTNPSTSTALFPFSSSSKPNTKVTLNTEWLDDKNPRIPTYRTRGRKRGEVLIINNIMFENKNDRKGAKKDEDDLTNMFAQMGFRITRFRDLKKNNMQSEIKSFSKKSSLKDVDMSIVIVMSHGTNRSRLGGYTEIFGVDDQPCVIDELLNYFTAENCKYMKEKPKIFIFQCCRGNNEKFIESDAIPFSKPNATGFSDMLIAFSTVPGFVSHRDTVEGTWYIQTICKVFSEHAHQEHIEDLLKMVDAEMGKIDNTTRQISTYESRGFKRCYLHPRK